MNLKYIFKSDLIDAIACELVFIDLRKLYGVFILVNRSLRRSVLLIF